jgi:hypothetical protein
MVDFVPGLDVKLFTIILAGPTVLSVVGACPPHDGVRRRWRINVESAVALFERSQKIGGSHGRTGLLGTKIKRMPWIAAYGGF